MTLANCGQRADGVVVLELEPGFPGESALIASDDLPCMQVLTTARSSLDSQVSQR